MDKKKVTRRAVIGTAIGTVAISPIIIRLLLDECEVDLPKGTRPMKLGGKIVTSYDGVEVEIEVPEMVIETPEDEKKFKELVMEEVKKTPQFAEQNRKKLRDVKRRDDRKSWTDSRELEKEQRKTIANAIDLSESGKAALQKQALEDLRKSEEAALKQIEDLAIPAKL